MATEPNDPVELPLINGIAPGAGRVFKDEQVRRAAQVVDGMGIVRRIADWKSEARKGPGGRPETFPTRALVVAMVMCAWSNQPVLVTVFRDVMFAQMSPKMRTELGIPDPPSPENLLGWDALYRNVRTRFHSMVDLMDPSVLPKNRRLSPEVFLASTRLLSSLKSEVEQKVCYERLEWFVNQVLEASFRMIPRAIRRRWKGSVAVDATFVRSYAAHPKRTQSRVQEIVEHSADPDGGWQVRTTDEEEPNRRGGKSKKQKAAGYGYEASLVVSTQEDLEADPEFPNVVVAMAVLHRPGAEPGQNGIRALSSVNRRGHPANYLAGDRAYSNSKPEQFQLPAHAMGYKPVFDYKKTQFGIQDGWQGFIQVEGAWYCPAMPKAQVNATADYDARRIDEATYRARLKERWNYLAKPKAAPDEDGYRRYQCPASGSCPSARCELKPKSESANTRGRTRVVVPEALKADPPPCCTQASVTIAPSAGAKLDQDLIFESEEWTARYNTLRNTIEGFNGFVKDGSKEALDEPERRRVHGVAAQSIFTALLIFAANVRKIVKFLAEQRAIATGKMRRLPPRRVGRSLVSYLPEAPGTEASPGPDPPRTA
jgi:hypothetical protein